MYLVSGKKVFLVKFTMCKKLADTSRFRYKFKYRCKILKYENIKMLFVIHWKRRI